MDTIVIPDPVLRIADFRPHLNPSDLLYFTAKHALNALTYRDLALADVDPPIVVITSDYLGADVSRVQQLKHLAEIDLRAHFERVFARSFADGSELASFLGQFASIEQLAAMVSDSKRVLFDLDWPDNVAEQIQRHLESTGSRFTVEARSWLQDRPPGPLVSDHLRGRLMQTNDIVLSSQGLSGTPLVDAPTSWQYLVWKYEYDVARTAVEPDSAAHLLITRALQSTTEDDRLRVLRVTPKVLVELRRDGVLEELRQILRAGMEDISFAAAADLEGVTNEIAANVNSAMLEHQTRIDGLVRSGIRWYGLELAPMVVSASMSIIGAATGNVPLTTIGAVGSALGVPTMKDVYRHGKRVLADYRHLRRSASGILFRNV